MGDLLWIPGEDRIENSNLRRFIRYAGVRFARAFHDYAELHRWSVNHLDEFWSAVWDFTGIQASRPARQIIDDPHKMPGARWFSGARLNFAENLLRRNDAHTALAFVGEDGRTRRLSYRALRDEVGRLAAVLRDLGVAPGDRVAAFMPNVPETVVAMLATASVGAVWSACSPDFGRKGVLDRFGQIRPKVLFTADGYRFKGNSFDSLQRAAGIADQLPELVQVIVVPHLDPAPDLHGLARAARYGDLLAARTGGPPAFAQLPFEHPLYIMYSSGTTGLPKCMVQSAGGVLINQLKELVLHTDLTPQDVLFYYTTCGWMMWNWLVCALAVGATVVLYDGSPFHPRPDALWQMAQELRVSIFGTSAAYLAFIESQGARPGKHYDLSPLKAVLSTGSPLSPESFAYVYREIKSDLQVASISGGSDINGCFALGNPTAPVYAGELQCIGLGMNVAAFNAEGRAVVDEQGELVCISPSPSMPIYFWDDPDFSKYRAAYFDIYPNVWRHGDFITINSRGGVVIHGRSDATLNPGGVRIGTSDIYRIVQGFAEIEDSVVIGQKWHNDIRVVLFVKMAAQAELTAELIARLKAALRDNASPRHVPAKIIAIPDIPYTLNMKKVEIAVRKTVQGLPVRNKDALRNPEALDFFKNIAALQEE
jgi:acetoacetyl-CoA synthetase